MTTVRKGKKKYVTGKKCPDCKKGIIHCASGGDFSSYATLRCPKCGKEVTGYDQIAMMCGIF